MAASRPTEISIASSHWQGKGKGREVEPRQRQKNGIHAGCVSDQVHSVTMCCGLLHRVRGESGKETVGLKGKELCGVAKLDWSSAGRVAHGRAD